MRNPGSIVAVSVAALLTVSCGQETSQPAPESFVDVVEPPPPPPPPPPPDYASPIALILLADDLIGQQTGVDDTRIARMRNVNLSSAPPDFREAYLRHVFAWERRVRAQNAWNSITTEEHFQKTTIEGVVCGFLDCTSNPIVDQIDAEQRLKEEMAFADEEIFSTFQNVKLLAVRHGVNLADAIPSE